MILSLFVVAVLSFSTVYASGWREDFDDYNINPNYYAGSSSSYIIENSYIKAKWAVISVENQQNCPYFDDNFDTEFKIYIGNISGTVPILEQRVEKYGTLFHSIKIDGNSFLLTNYVDGTQEYSSSISTGSHRLHLIYDGSLTLYVDGTKEITLPTSASYSSTDYIKFPVWNTSNVTWLDLVDIHPPVKEMTVSIEPDKDNYLPGDEALLTVTVQDQDGESMPNCEISETVTYPDGTQEYNILDWTDHGDGTYTSHLELPQSGTYSIGVIVSKEGYKDGEASTEFEVLDAAAIAEAYKPYMYYYQQGADVEKFRPTNIESSLHHSTFWRW
ncbi:MAG: Ig-like domain-containing protein, partial [Euryarchaeota archaeon]|nr:Ig-like domain-containing protein [Euryarchaeota archaeon]